MNRVFLSEGGLITREEKALLKRVKEMLIEVGFWIINMSWFFIKL